MSGRGLSLFNASTKVLYALTARQQGIGTRFTGDTWNRCEATESVHGRRASRAHALSHDLQSTTRRQGTWSLSTRSLSALALLLSRVSVLVLLVSAPAVSAIPIRRSTSA